MSRENLGHYRLLGQIGCGGMGDVFRAADLRLGRDVAIKFLKPEHAGDPDRLRRFEQEARAAAALNQPNIVAVYDFGVHEGCPYIVTELLSGQTLRQRLSLGAMPLRQVADTARQISQGLVAAHEKHIIHRDLKPENLFLTTDGLVKILDFGIAKLVGRDDPEKRNVATMTTQTKTGAVLGTVAYMSPEQLRARPVDHRSDIFSFGAILYEMITGRRAFAGETEVDTITAVLKEDPPEMETVRQDVPPAYAKIVSHCLEKDPERRFQSARDLAFALNTVTEIATGRTQASSSKDFAKLRKWISWATVAALAAGLAFWIGGRMRGASAPAYLRLSYQKGTVYSARFSADGRSVVYSAAWNGGPLQLYVTPSDHAQQRALDLGSVYLMSVSESGDAALGLHPLHGTKLDFQRSTLAQAPLEGGAPRELLENVNWADWDGKGQLAVDHDFQGKSRLEYPIGHVLYETSGEITNPRFSPKRDSIAFIDHKSATDDRGSICIVSLRGEKKELTREWEAAFGLAWSPDGNEVWFTATDRGTERLLWAVNLSGKLRRVLEVPGGITLQDIGRDGRLLATFGSERLAMEISGNDSALPKDLSWYEWTIAKDISRNGEWVLFEESSMPEGPDYSVCARRLGQSVPVRLGPGSAGGLSPDGKWALAIVDAGPDSIKIMPTGPGATREMHLDGIEHVENGAARFLSDGRHVIFCGNESGRGERTFVVDLDGGKPRPVTPEGIWSLIASPDGRFLAGKGARPGEVAAYPVDGGEPHLLTHMDNGHALAQWSDDGSAFYVYPVNDANPLPIEKLEIRTGKMQPVKVLAPSERAGLVAIAPVAVKPDGTQFLYSYLQARTDLYVLTGLK
jgi:serine/threonine protein kinase/Tol biopolymer transport system component